jgi:hypothetical protein
MPLNSHKIELGIFLLAIGLLLFVNIVSAPLTNSSESSDTSEWTMFGRTLNSTRYYPGFVPSNISLLPIFNYTGSDYVGDETGATVWNGSVYVTDWDYVYQLNVSNFSQLLSRSTVYVPFSTPVIWNGSVYVGSDSGIKQLNASNVTQILGSKGGVSGIVYNNPVVSDGFVYYGGFGDGYVYQVNASNISQTIFTYNVANRCYAGATVYGGYLYIHCGSTLFQFNSTNISQKIVGSTIESSSTPYGVVPLVANGYVYYNTEGNKTMQLNATNISISVANFTAGNKFLTSPAYNNNSIYVHSTDGFLYQLNASNVTQQIGNISIGSGSSPTVTNNYVFVIGGSSVYQLDALNVSNMIANVTIGVNMESISIADGVLYVARGYIFHQIGDPLAPTVNVIYPMNGTNYTVDVNAINYTVTDNGFLNSCWYGNGTANSTTLSAGTNFTSVVSVQGWNNWTVYCNDTASNAGRKQVQFYMDTVAPTYSLNSTSSTHAGESVNHSLKWDDLALGGYIFSWYNGANWTLSNTTSDLENGVISLNSNPLYNYSFFDSFEDAVAWSNWTESGEGDWVIESNSSNVVKIGSFVAHSDDCDTLCMLVSNSLDLRGWISGNISFNYGITGLDAGEFLNMSIYNGTNYNNIFFVGNANSSGTTQGTYVLNITPYIASGSVSNFYINITTKESATTEYAEFDIFNITIGRGHDSNTTRITYNIPSNIADTIRNITVSVDVSSYSNYVSSILGNSNPDLWLEVYDGSNWVDVGNFSITSTGTKTLTTQQLPPLSWIDPLNRNIRITGRYFDVNETHYDEINYTSVLVTVNSTGEFLNDTWMPFVSDTWSNVTKTINSTTGATIKWCVYANDTLNNWNSTSCSNPFTYITDTGNTPPIWSGNVTSLISTTTYSPNTNYGFQVNWNDNVDSNGYNFSYIEHNFTGILANYTTIRSGNVSYYNFTGIGAGNWQWRFYANDSSDRWNNTDLWNYIVTQNTSTANYIILIIDGEEANKSVTHPTTTNATGWYSPSFNGQTITFMLYRNTTSIGTANPISDNLVLGAGDYNYTYYTGGNVNYSSATEQLNLSIIQNNTNPINIFLINSTGAYQNQNISIANGTETTANSTLVYSNSGSSLLYENGSSVYNPTAATLSIGTYSYKGNTTGNENYTSNSTGLTYYIIVLDRTAPNVTLNLPTENYFNDTSDPFNITFNCSATDNYNLTNISLYITSRYNVTLSFNQTRSITGVSNSTLWTLNLSSGNYTWNCLTYDSYGNFNWSTNRTIKINYTDTDNDGLSNTIDPLLYNESNVNTSGISNLNITVGGNSTSGLFNSVQNIIFNESSNMIINFTHNFTYSQLDLSKITIIKSTNYIIVNLSSQLQSDYNKTIYIDDNNFVSLCVKDAEVSSVSDISSSCNGVNETDFTTCLGGSASINGINCTDEGTRIRINNLRFSAIRGTPQTVAESGSTGSYSSGGGTVVDQCASDTECGAKKACINKKCKSVECKKNIDCSEKQYCSDYKCYDYECIFDSECKTDQGEECSNYHCVKLFDIIIENFQPSVKVGQFFNFTYLIKSMGNITDDVEITFWIEKEGAVLTSGKDTIYVGPSGDQKNTAKIFLPSTIKPDVYTFFVQVSYKDYSASSYRTIEVAVDKEGNAVITDVSDRERTLTYVVIGLASFSVLLLIIVIIMRRSHISLFFSRIFFNVSRTERKTSSSLKDVLFFVERIVYKIIRFRRKIFIFFRYDCPAKISLLILKLSKLKRKIISFFKRDKDQAEEFSEK